MTTRRRNQVGSHDVQQHVRYVEVYTIDDPEVEEQPVQVKALTWSGTVYGMYGASFRVGDVSLVGVVSTGDRFWVIWRRDALRWERVSGGSGSTPPLRAFELTADKTLTQSSATAKWLDDAGNLIGDNVTIYDPGFRFAGRATAFYTGDETGFRGYALLRADLGAIEPDRWEIVTMESFAEWAVVEYYGADLWVLSPAGFGGGEWDYRRPCGDGAFLGIIDPAEILPETPTADAKAIARLAWPDTTPPTYAIQSTKGGGSAGGVRFIKLSSTWPGATSPGDGICIPSIISSYELIANPETGNLNLGSPMSALWYGAEDIVIASGRWRVGIVQPLSVNSEILVLIDPGCLTFGDYE